MSRFGLPGSINPNSKSNSNLRQISHSRIDNEEIIFNKYEMGRKIGQGSFGIVFEIKNRFTADKFALKIISKEKAGNKSFSYEKEVEIMKSVTHKNLVKLEEVFETKKKLYLVTELCERGELAKWIKSRGTPTSERESKKIMKQIVDAISYLHKNDIVHRDLKLENILIKEIDPNTEECYIKITDFGLSSQREAVGAEGMFDDYCGTPLYMAPEIIENHPYSQLCDVWALGIIMYFLLTNHSPFTADSDSKLREQIRRAEIDETSKNYNHLSPEAKDCIKRMICVNPVHRIASVELLKHPWFLDKKMEDLAESQKNVIELMKEMLHEQENEYNCANNSTHIESTSVTAAKMKSTANSVDTSLKIDTRKSEAKRPDDQMVTSRLVNANHYNPSRVVNTGNNNNGRARSQIVSHSAHALNDFQPNIKISNLRLLPPNTPNNGHFNLNVHGHQMTSRAASSTYSSARASNPTGVFTSRRANIDPTEKSNYAKSTSLAALNARKKP